MPLVHKSLSVRPEVWRKLRLDAELSGAPLRDFFTYLVERAAPVSAADREAVSQLQSITKSNAAARSETS